MLYTYSIVALNEDHIDEICEDIARQYQSGITLCPLFLLKIHSEGKPPIPKAEIQGKIFDKFRDKLAAAGVPCGILAQATLGHGYALDDGLSFTPYVTLTDGKEEPVSCPLDPDWLEYMKNAMAELASHHPKAIMLDDDCRLLSRPGRGCACPRHMDLFNRRAGTHMTREELYAHIKSHPAGDPLTEIFLNTQRDALRGAMLAMREGVDSVDPTIQGINCLTHRTCEIVTDAWNIFSGKGNPVIVRLPNGSYAPSEVRHFSEMMFRTRATIAALRGKADIILAETDTIPFNRYGKSAVYLKGHFAATLLDGCMGAKHWITRLCAHEPKSGVAFRKVLSENKEFFETVIKLGKAWRPVGACIPFGQASYRYDRSSWALTDDHFAECVLERMGIPLFFSDEPQKCSWINGSGADDLTDETLSALFKGGVVLSSDVAQKLIDRGFGNEIGVTVRPYKGIPITSEVFPNGNTCHSQVGIMELVPTSPDTRAMTWAYHLTNGKDKTHLFPASTLYEKPDGSFTVTFAGTPKANFNYMEAFSFLNETRKEQLLSILRKAGELPVFADTDAEILMRAGWLADGALLVASWNLGWDVLDDYPLVTEKPVAKIEKLAADGTWQPLPFRTEGCRSVVATEMRPIDPVFLRITFAEN